MTKKGSSSEIRYTLGVQPTFLFHSFLLPFDHMRLHLRGQLCQQLRPLSLKLRYAVGLQSQRGGLAVIAERRLV